MVELNETLSSEFQLYQQFKNDLAKIEDGESDEFLVISRRTSFSLWCAIGTLECFSFVAIYLTFLELSALHVNDESLAQKLEDFGKDQSKDDLGKRYFMNVMNFFHEPLRLHKLCKYCHKISQNSFAL